MKLFLNLLDNVSLHIYRPIVNRYFTSLSRRATCLCPILNIKFILMKKKEHLFFLYNGHKSLLRFDYTRREKVLKDI